MVVPCSPQRAGCVVYVTSPDWISDIGANPSAEEAQEDTDDQAQTVIDVVHSFRLNETSFDKKSYLTHLKSKATRIP